jgi:transcriptional regulator GlxA family with amidase domain
MQEMAEEHRVLVVGHSGVHGMELLGVRDMFEFATYLGVRAGLPSAYRVEVASVDGTSLDLGRGLTLGGVLALCEDTEPIDTLAVIGGMSAWDAAADAELVAAIGAAAGRAGRVISTCSGAFLLAAAGLLDGRRATTHWDCAERLAADYPAIAVEPDAIYLRDGDIWTSAGVTAAHDLVLALVEHDLGADRALELARQIVVSLRREGGQTQFSVQLASPPVRRQPIREVQQYILANPGADLSLAALADRAHLSTRHFARLFRSEVGMSAGSYVERVRLEAARRLVERTDHPLDTVAADTGFGSADNLRRVFISALGVGPADYRRRFNPYQHTTQHTA